MNDWSVTRPGESFRRAVLSILTHEQFRATIGRSGLCFTAGRPVTAPVVRPAPDPERDARVAARREAARRRASADLDRFIANLYGALNDRCECRQFGWSDRCPLHH